MNIGIFLKIEDCEGGGHLICRVVLYLSKYGIIMHETENVL
jgi:hypothetical protein